MSYLKYIYKTNDKRVLEINKTLEKVRRENSSLFTPIPGEDIRIRREMTTNLIINIIKNLHRPFQKSSYSNKPTIGC